MRHKCGVFLHPKSWYDGQYNRGQFCGFTECEVCAGALDVRFEQWVLHQFDELWAGWY